MPFTSLLLLLAAPDPAPQTYDAIILGSGKTEAEATSVLDDLGARIPWVRYAGGSFPGVVKSDKLEGLKPGHYVAVLGLCDPSRAGEVKRLLKAVNALRKGAHVKKVRGAHDKPSCPPLAAFQRPSGAEAKQLARLSAEPRSAEAFYQYALFLEGHARLEEANVFVNHAIELDPEHAESHKLAQRLWTLLFTD